MRSTLKSEYTFSCKSFRSAKFETNLVTVTTASHFATDFT